MTKIHERIILFLCGMLFVLCLDIAWGMKAYGQVGAVKCRSIQHPDVVQIFPCCMCPIGWTPAK